MAQYLLVRNKIKSEECSTRIHGLHVRVKGVFNEILDLFTRLGHDQMDHNYCYFVIYICIYDLTTKILFFFFKGLSFMYTIN